MTKITSKYVIVIVFLTVVVLFSQYFMQNTISNSESDSRIINIAGRQRMLSQRITKYALIISNETRPDEFTQAQQELAETYSLWTNSHHDLKFGSSDINTKEMNKDEKISTLYGEIETYYANMVSGVELILPVQVNQVDSAAKDADLQAGLALIRANESQFLKLMNELTFQYDTFATSKIEQLSKVEWYLMAATLFLILSEIIFIFFPVVKQAKRQQVAISELNLTRDDEKAYASSQIKEANQKIRKLRKLALKIHEEKEEAAVNFTSRITQQMVENATLKTKLEHATQSVL